MLRTHAVTADSDRGRNPAAEATSRSGIAAHPLEILHRSVGNRALALTLQRKCDCGGSGASCECESDELHRSANGPGPETAPPIVHDVLRSPGAALDGTARGVMESYFGRDLDDVVVHHDANAAASARAVGASAYTVGQHIVFGERAYRPETTDGRRLIAHELTHVTQQGSDASALNASLEIGAADTASEREAESAAENYQE